MLHYTTITTADAAITTVTVSFNLTSPVSHSLSKPHTVLVRHVAQMDESIPVHTVVMSIHVMVIAGYLALN